MKSQILKGMIFAIGLSVMASACSGGNDTSPTVSNPDNNPSGSNPTTPPAALTAADKTEASNVVASVLKMTIDTSDQYFSEITCSGLNLALKKLFSTNLPAAQGNASTSTSTVACDDSDHFGSSFSAVLHFNDFVEMGATNPGVTGDYHLDVQNSDGDVRMNASAPSIQANGKTYVITKVSLDVGGDPQPSCSGAVTVNGVPCQVAADCLSCAF